MSRYSAQKQFWKAKQAKHEKDKIADVVLLQKLQVTYRCIYTQTLFKEQSDFSSPESHGSDGYMVNKMTAFIWSFYLMFQLARSELMQPSGAMWGSVCCTRTTSDLLIGGRPSCTPFCAVMTGRSA